MRAGWYWARAGAAMTTEPLSRRCGDAGDTLRGDVEPGPQQRILVVIAAASIEAGPVKGCLQFIRQLRGRELAFHLVNFRRPGDVVIGRRFATAAEAVGVPVAFIVQHGHGYAALARELAAMAARERIDIVQSHGFKPAVLCAWLRLRHGLSWICFCHGATAENWRVRCYHAAERAVRLFADRIVLVAAAQQGGLLRLRARGVRVIHNAVDPESPVAVSAAGVDVRATLGLGEGTRLLVAVGRLSPEKGIDVLLAAIARLHGEGGRDLHLALVGEGPQARALRAQASRLGMAARVTFVGHVSTPGDFLQAADIVVLPSRSEGIANVALEAMALGRPLVATAVGGTPEIVRDGASGLLVPADDAAALARAVERVLADPALAAHLARGARDHARAELSVTARGARLRALYAEFLPRAAVTTADRAGA